MRVLIQASFDFLTLGSLYALFALGLALIFGIVRFINFAHGELMVLAGYAVFLVGPHHVMAKISIALVTGAVAAVLMERIAFRPIRGARITTQLITSFALSFLIQNVIMVVFGARAKSVGMPPFLTEQVALGRYRFPHLDWITVIVAGVLMAGLGLFLTKTRVGVEMRAAAEDFEMARLLGVRADRVIATAFAISGLLAASAAIILVARGGTVFPAMGLRPVVIAFVAVILGGLGSLIGAAAGGFALAFLTVFLQAYLPSGLRSFRDVFVFGLVIVIFLLRPQGIVFTRRAAIRA